MKQETKIKAFKMLVSVWLIYGVWCAVADSNPSQSPQPAPVAEAEWTDNYPHIIGLVQAKSPEDLYIKYFGDRADEAKRVAKCESGMNPNAHNLKTDDRGLMQINYSTWHKVFGDVNYYDPETNIRLSKDIYDRSGSWNPWKSSRKCHNL